MFRGKHFDIHGFTSSKEIEFFFTKSRLLRLIPCRNKPFILLRDRCRVRVERRGISAPKKPKQSQKTVLGRNGSANDLFSRNNLRRTYLCQTVVERSNVLYMECYSSEPMQRSKGKSKIVRNPNNFLPGIQKAETQRLTTSDSFFFHSLARFRVQVHEMERERMGSAEKGG